MKYRVKHVTIAIALLAIVLCRSSDAPFAVGPNNVQLRIVDCETSKTEFELGQSVYWNDSRNEIVVENADQKKFLTLEAHGKKLVVIHQNTSFDIGCETKKLVL
jgi:hypothetical protein